MTEFPKRARTIRWENDILIFDGERTIEMPELTMEIMEKLADYKPVGFYVKNNALTDELLMPFIGSKNMVNFGVEYGRLTDVCFSVFATMPKLRYLLLDGNRRITGSSLNVMKECKIDLLTLNHTGLNDNGLLQAASIPKLTHIQIDHTAVTYEGLLNIAFYPRIEPISKEQFNQEQMEHFSKLQREKAKKTVKLDQQAVEECQKILKDFFEAMPIWEMYWTIVNKVDTIYKEKCRVQLLSAVPSTILLFHLVSSFRENYAVSWHYRILRCIRIQITGVPAENDMFYG